MSRGRPGRAKYFEGFYGVTVPELLVTYAVPEPASLAFGTAALAGLGLAVWRRAGRRDCMPREVRVVP